MYPIPTEQSFSAQAICDLIQVFPRYFSYKYAIRCSYHISFMHDIKELKLFLSMTEEAICQLIMVSGTTCASRGHQVYGNGMYTRMEKQQELR